MAVDGVVVVDNQKILLIRRAHLPFMDKLVLPGGHVDETDKNTKYACARELEEEIGLQVLPEKLVFLTILDDINRDPRKPRLVSIAYRVDVSSEDIESCKAATDAREIILRDIQSIKPEEIGFDHYLAIEILQKQLTSI